ncbi:fructokinase [Rhizobiales bacterium GAS191]|jgi:fructokinase|nr:fructokinase [Rhizobiales bacterium GAS113]SEC01705.1 fructokinase [Rhizobiales bacterium GAS191]SED17291.1 fructokinase [Rhizobiales bacterium GAS188]
MRIGVDLGGTKIEVAVLDTAGLEIARQRTPTPHGDYEGSVRAIAELVRAIAAKTGAQGSVGMGIPGAISAKTGLVMTSNATFLVGRALDKDLAAALGRKVRIENDANCFALAEAVDGAARGAHCVFGAILGTGVGAGIVLDHKVFSGNTGIAGEWGHNPLPWPEATEFPGPACYCGRYGCMERYVSGTAFTADHAAKIGRKMKGDEIVAAMRAGDAEARATYQRYAKCLARGLAVIANVLDPNAFVLGGGMSNVDELYQDLPSLMRPHVLSKEFDTPILKPLHGDSAGVRGAAWLWGDGDLDEAAAS